MPAFVTGTKNFFNQATAPTGWTISTTNTDYTLRIVSGSTGGTLVNTENFSTKMANGATWIKSPTSSTVTSIVSSDAADLPAHTHTYQGYNVTSSQPNQFLSKSSPTNLSPIYVISTPSFSPDPNTPTSIGGTGSKHSHSLTVTAGYSSPDTTANLAVQYLDFILAIKN